MTLFAIHSRILLVLVVGLLASPRGWAGDELSGWKASQAGKYLDERAKSWFAFSAANRLTSAHGRTSQKVCWA